MEAKNAKLEALYLSLDHAYNAGCTDVVDSLNAQIADEINASSLARAEQYLLGSWDRRTA